MPTRKIGTGLGLTIVKELLDLMGATIEVPMVQQSTVDYLNNPAAANKKIVDMLDQLKEVVYSAGEADYAVKTMKEDIGLISNGPDATLGNFDMDRVQEGIDQMIAAGITNVPKDLKANQLTTNEFIDPAIGL